MNTENLLEGQPEPEAHFDYNLQQALDEPEIDAEIKPAIKELWQNVAPLCGSCSGHGDATRAYFSFRGRLTEAQMRKAQDIARKYGYNNAVFRYGPPIKDLVTEMRFGVPLTTERVGYEDDDGEFTHYLSRPITVGNRVEYSVARKVNKSKYNPTELGGLR